MDKEFGAKLYFSTGITLTMGIAIKIFTMGKAVITRVGQFKILKSIIQSVIVLVVNNLRSSEAAIEGFFHDITMFKYSSTVDHDPSIARFCNASGPLQMADNNRRITMGSKSTIANRTKTCTPYRLCFTASANRLFHSSELYRGEL